MKKSYRNTLRRSAGPDLLFVYVACDRALLAERIVHRSGHFMPLQLLDSQLATLEPPIGEIGVVTVDGADRLETEIAQALEFVKAQEGAKI